MRISYDPIIFCQQESLDLEEFVLATYLVSADTSDVLMRAGAVAVEQTTGTWARVPDETDEVRRGHVARVVSVHNIPGYEANAPAGERTCVMTLAFPWRNFGHVLPQMLSTIFGNIAAVDNLKLLDVQFPKSFVQGFAGPQFGVQGVRDLLGVHDRPPVLAMIKPCTGIPVDVIERQFYQLAIAGIDLVKDDELIADPAHAPFFERLEACLRASDRAYEETGHRAIYLPNITDRQDRVLDKARRAVEMGAKALMLNAHATGYGLLGAIAADPSLNVPLLAHPCFSGTYYLSPRNGLSSSLVNGKFMRLDGADIVVYGLAYGKVPGLTDRYQRVAQSLLSGFHGLKNTLPSPAAGLYPGLIPQMMCDLGPDVVLGAGAAMHAHPLGIAAGIQAMIQATEAWAQDIPLEDYRQDHVELDASLKIWPEYRPDQSIFELTN